MTLPWLLAERLCSLPCGLLHRASSLSSCMAAGFPRLDDRLRERERARESEEEANSFFCPNLGCHTQWHHSIHEKQGTKYSAHLRGRELGFTINERSVKDSVELHKTPQCIYTQEVQYLPLLLTAHWLELSHMTTESMESWDILSLLSVAMHPTENCWSITRRQNEVPVSVEVKMKIY